MIALSNCCLAPVKCGIFCSRCSGYCAPLTQEGEEIAGLQTDDWLPQTYFKLFDALEETVETLREVDPNNPQLVKADALISQIDNDTLGMTTKELALWHESWSTGSIIGDLKKCLGFD